MPRIKKVEGHDELVKSTASNAVLNSNKEAFNEFKSRKLRERETNDRLDSLESNLSTLQTNVNAMTELLESINKKLK